MSILNKLGFKSYIKFTDKGFDDLEDTDIADMLEEHVFGFSNKFELGTVYEVVLIPHKTKRMKELVKFLKEVSSQYRDGVSDGVDTPRGLEEIKKHVIFLRQR